MGITYVDAVIRNPADPAKKLKEEFLVDSGAVYTVVPKEYLKKLGIKPHRTQTFMLADGTRLERQVGNAIYEYKGEEGAAPVVFGEKGDRFLLGAVTLEALGLVLNPFSRTLHPMKLLMM